MLRRLLLLLIVAIAALAAATLTPAWACGCGAYAPEHGGAATVPMETALVRVNADGTEDVYLSLSLDSTVRSGALLFPVPDKAAVVTAGPTRLFAELNTLTAPPLVTGAPGSGGNRAGAPHPGVTVEKRQQIGPLDVVTLSSGDSAALTRWLESNGFAAKPALSAAAKPYTDMGWAFVAVRLRPGAGSGATLSGTLDPLRIHFASKDVVYPMRLSAMAIEPEQVRVYTLAAHRLDLGTADPGMTLTWADNLNDLRSYPDLANVVGGDSRYLTRFDGNLTPASITDDFHFSAAASDASHRPGAGPRAPAVVLRSPASSDHTARDVLLGVLAISAVLTILTLTVRRRPR